MCFFWPSRSYFSLEKPLKILLFGLLQGLSSLWEEVQP